MSHMANASTRGMTGVRLYARGVVQGTQRLEPVCSWIIQATSTSLEAYQNIARSAISSLLKQASQHPKQKFVQTIHSPNVCQVHYSCL